MKVKNVNNTYLGSPSYQYWELINFVLDYLHSNFVKKSNSRISLGLLLTH